MHYGKMLSMWAAMDPSLPWDRTDVEQWTELIAQDRCEDGLQSDSCHVLAVGWVGHLYHKSNS